MSNVTELMKRWAKEDREFLAFIEWKERWLKRLIIIGLFAVIILSISIGNAPHTAVEWGPLQGCLIKVDGQWIPEDRYREVAHD